MYIFDLQSAEQSELQSANCTADSYETCTFQYVIPMDDLSKYDRHGCESPFGYGALRLTTHYLLHVWLTGMVGDVHTNKGR